MHSGQFCLFVLPAVLGLCIQLAHPAVTPLGVGFAAGAAMALAVAALRSLSYRADKRGGGFAGPVAGSGVSSLDEDDVEFYGCLDDGTTAFMLPPRARAYEPFVDAAAAGGIVGGATA